MAGCRFVIALLLIALAPGACAPTMPVYPVPTESRWLEQGWTPAQQFFYHRLDQGTLTFGIPFEWFVALEQPSLTLNEAPLVRDKTWLDRFGFIPGDQLLPVGFAVGGGFDDPVAGVRNNPANNGKQYTGIGLTCAACHTGRMTHEGKEILIDGGSALTDLVDFNKSLVISMVYTQSLPFRFRRFAGRVLGGDATDQARDQLRAQFDAVVSQIRAVGDKETATEKGVAPEGFGRLDALTRIGNRVFGVDLCKTDECWQANYLPRTAPVHYPHIWTAPWFTWVQYNGSIMQPMVRNAGEALGVGAKVNATGTGAERFDSSVQVGHLFGVEQVLGGKTSPFRDKAFSGLQPPAWPSTLPPIDTALAAKGSGLYKELCQGCHLPPVNTAEFWKGGWWSQIGGERYLDLHQIPLREIGTDPRQASDMASRTVMLPNDFNTLPDKLKFKSNAFGPALGQFVQNVTSRWYDTQMPPISPAQQSVMNGGRPNELRTPLAYKARPLNGIWATPPYLHNGSVPSLYALLSPAGERPPVVYLGNREYDPADVGYRNVAIPGGSALDTNLSGNSNKGHEFRDAPKGNGVIGRGLAPEERRALIEYLKTQ